MRAHGSCNGFQDIYIYFLRKPSCNVAASVFKCQQDDGSSTLLTVETSRSIFVYFRKLNPSCCYIFSEIEVTVLE